MMILIGQYDSPFVRRVGIALRLYKMPFEHQPWSVFADGEKIRLINSLGRVPVLVLETGFALTDSLRFWIIWTVWWHSPYIHAQNHSAIRL